MEHVIAWDERVRGKKSTDPSFRFLERKRVSTPLDSISSRWNERLRFCEERVGGETNDGGSVGKHVPRKRGKFNGSS